MVCRCVAVAIGPLSRTSEQGLSLKHTYLLRAQLLVGDLSRQTRTANTDLELKTATMALINALVCAGPGRHSVVFRMHLRMELLQLGMLEILDRLRCVRVCVCACVRVVGACSE